MKLKKNNNKNKPWQKQQKMLICWEITPLVDKFNCSSPPFSTGCRFYPTPTLFPRLVCIPGLSHGFEWGDTESLLFWRRPWHLVPSSADSLACDLISIFIVYQPWGSILARDAFTNERNHRWALASWLHRGERAEESLVDYRATWGWSTNTSRQRQHGWVGRQGVGQGFLLQLLAPATCTPSYLTKII